MSHTIQFKSIGSVITPKPAIKDGNKIKVRLKSGNTAYKFIPEISSDALITIFSIRIIPKISNKENHALISSS